MKTLIGLLFFVSLFVISCESLLVDRTIQDDATDRFVRQEQVFEPIEPDFQSEAFLSWIGRFFSRFHFEARWNGLPFSNCSLSAGSCGRCPAVCIYFEWIPIDTSYQFTTQQIDAGQGGLLAKLLKDSDKLWVVPETSIDDGTGEVSIERDFFIGADASKQLGVDSVFILEGFHPILYSDSTSFGEVKFTVRWVD